MHRLKLMSLLAICLSACGAPDLDEDGFDDTVDCDDSDAAIHPDADEIVGNDVDEDCDGVAEPFPDVDGDGFGSNEDCDDDNADINPGATEVLGNDVDEDCDGEAQPYAFLGEWTLTDAAFVEDGDREPLESPSGSLDIADSLDADLVFATAQQGFSATFTLAGAATPGASDTAFSMETEGELVSIGKGERRYPIAATLDCTLNGAMMDCSAMLTFEGESEISFIELSFSEQ